jgi:hypothetical protein
VLSGDLETRESLANFQIHKHNNNNNGVFIMTQIIIITRYATALLPILKNTCFFHGLAAAAAKENTNRRERERERERERAKWT